MKLLHSITRNMKITTLIKIAFGLAAMSFLSSCVVNDGPVGPQGPQGIPGQDGNANVFSIRYDVTASDWVVNGIEGQPGYFLELEIAVPEIDNLIVEDGLVLAYYRAVEGDPWILLPYTFISSTADRYVEVFDFIYGQGFVNFKSQADDAGPATAYEGTVRLIIADGIPIAKQAIDYKDFDAVSEFLNLDEAVELQRSLKTGPIAKLD